MSTHLQHIIICDWVKLPNTYCVVSWFWIKESPSFLFCSIHVKIRPSHFWGLNGTYVRTYLELWRTSRLCLQVLRGVVGRLAPCQVRQPSPPPRRHPGLHHDRPARDREKDGSSVRSMHSECQESIRKVKNWVLPTWMRKSLALLSIYLLSKQAKIRDKRTAFPSAPYTQPSSPWEDSTARKQSPTGLLLSAA